MAQASARGSKLPPAYRWYFVVPHGSCSQQESIVLVVVDVLVVVGGVQSFTHVGEQHGSWGTHLAGSMRVSTE